MTGWMSIAGDWVWRGAITATPAVLLIALLTRLIPARPATRHALWVLALAWFVAAPFVPAGPFAWPNLAGFIEPRNASCSPAAASPVDTAPPTIPTLIEYASTAPTPPGTGARTEACSPPSLAQASCPDERRSTLPSAPFPNDRSPAISSCEFAAASDFPAQPAAFEPAAGEAQLRPAFRDAPPTGHSPILMTILDESTARSAVALVSEHWQLCLTAAWLLGGAALLIARVSACRRFIKHLLPISPTPAHVQRMVDDVAAQLDLLSAPTVVMVENCISPMVACFGRRTLYLPAALWSDLDDQGRRAVLFHEFAHLRRRDHWVRFADSLISAIYWWNPCVWFVRRCIHEEAENCCDSWVTWLWPEGRKPYARALLKTSAFIAEGRMPMPALGIAMTSVRARRFARRLTMVMTETSRPRLSLSGIALAAALAAAGWLLTPNWSYADNCPDDEKPGATVAAPAPPDAPETAEAPEPPELAEDADAIDAMIADGDSDIEAVLALDDSADSVEVVPVAGVGDLITLMNSGAAAVNTAMGMTDEDGPRMRRRHADDDDDEDTDARIERLERRIEELVARLESRAGATPAPRARAGRSVNVFPRTLAVPGMPMPPAAPDAPKEDRVYKVSPGKLDALVQLMSRQDVPILIRPGNGEIQVSATPQEHAVFEAFIQMIDPKQGASHGGPAAAAIRTPAPPAIPLAPRAAVGRGMARSMGGAAGVREGLRKREIEESSLDQQRAAIEEQAEQLRERAEELKERAMDLKNEARDALLAEANQLAAQGRELAAHGRALERNLRNAHRDRARVEAEAARPGSDDGDDDDDDDNHAGSQGGAMNMLKSHLRQLAEEKKNAAASENWYDKGYSLHTKEKYDQAIECFQKSAAAGDRVAESYYNIACGYSLKGDKDRAFEFLRKAWQAGYQEVDHMQQDSDLNNIRKDPRYQEIIGAKHKKHEKKNDDDDDDDASR